VSLCQQLQYQQDVVPQLWKLAGVRRTLLVRGPPWFVHLVFAAAAVSLCDPVVLSLQEASTTSVQQLLMTEYRCLS